MAGLVALFVLVNEYGEFLYRGGFILTGLATATAIGVVVRPGSLLGRAIGVSPMRWLGTRSYGVYLWHWPVIVFGGPYLVSRLGSEWAGPVAIAATLVVADLSYRYVEGRFRRPSPSGQIRLGWLRPQWMGLAVATVGATALAFVVPTGLINEQPLMASVAVSGISSSSSGSVELADIEPKVPSDEATSFVVQSPVVLPESSTGAPVSQDPRATALVARSLAQASGLSWGQTEAQVEAAKLTVLAIGDSVMRGAAGRLAAELGEEATIDAEVNRQFTAGIRLLDRLRVRDALPDVVVVHLGTNSAINPSHFGEMMTVLEDVPRVVFVTVRVPRRYEGVVNGILEEGVLEWPNAVLADWYGFSDDHQGFFVRDGVHLTATGADAYVGLIAETIRSSPSAAPDSAA